MTEIKIIGDDIFFNNRLVARFLPDILPSDYIGAAEHIDNVVGLEDLRDQIFSLEDDLSEERSLKENEEDENNRLSGVLEELAKNIKDFFEAVDNNETSEILEIYRKDIFMTLENEGF